MIPKLIHIINPSNNLYQDIKTQNSEWEIIIWKNTEIKKELKKYPKIFLLYNQTISIKSKDTLAKYVIMKEHGGVYYDINENKNMSCSLNNLLSEKQIQNIIYISVSFYFYFFSVPYLNFLAMERNHPIWQDIIHTIEQGTDNYAIDNAFNNCLYQSEYPIIELFKQNRSFQIWQNTNSLNKQKHIRFIQLIMLIIIFIVIFLVEKLYHYNVSIYGAVNFIPGLGVVSNSSDKKKKREK